MAQDAMTPAAEPPHPGDVLPHGARVRLGTTRLNHVVQRGNTGVCHIAFSPDGRYLLGVGYQDDEASLWELPGGREVWRRELDCGCGPVAASAFSPDSRLVVIQGRGSRILEVATGNTIRHIREGDSGPEPVFSPCDRFLIEPAGRDELRAVDGWEVVNRLRGDGFGQMAISQDGRFLAGVGESLGVWEWPGGQVVNQWEADTRGVNALCFLPGGRVATSGEDEIVRVWEIATGRELCRHPWGDRGDNIFPAVFRPDGLALALPYPRKGKPTRVIDVESGAELGRYGSGQGHGKAFCLAWSPDGRILAAAEDGRCHLWDTTTGRDLAPPGRHYERPDTVVFSADGRRVLTAGSRDHDAYVWDAATGRLVGTVPPAIVLDQRSLTPPPDGTLVAAFHGQLLAHHDGGPKGPHLYLGELESGRVQEFPLDSAPTAVAWAADGRSLAALMGETVSAYPPGASAPNLPRLPGGHVVWRREDGLVISDAPDRLATKSADAIPGLIKAVSPDGRFVAADDWIGVYPLPPVGVAVGKRAARPVHSPFVIPYDFGRASFNGLGHSVEFLADGRLLVAACRGNPESSPPPYLVKVWEAATGLEVWESPGFPGGIAEVVFAPGGRTLAVALDDSTTVLFDIPVRPLAVDPSWLTSTVVQLARGIAAERALDRLPILADALQDAGCDDPDVLDLCRGATARGLWVVDLILEKE